jgi:hypothetical protein
MIFRFIFDLGAFFIYHLIRRSSEIVFFNFIFLRPFVCDFFYPLEQFRKQICNTFYKENTIYDFLFNANVISPWIFLV